MEAWSDTEAWLERAGAGSLAHPGGTLLEHLRRTATKLETWGADPTLIWAGLCHAAYGTQGYPHALCDLQSRGRLREQIGDAAEAVVYAYGSLDRAQPQPSRCELRDRFSGEYCVPATRMLRQLAELTIANELDVAEHATLTRAQLTELFEMAASWAEYASPAAWSALTTAASAHAVALQACGPCGDEDLAYRALGSGGPQCILWHGGAAPEMTWARQMPLHEHCSLRIPWRRGFTPSCTSERQDWELDTRDLLRVMPERSHVVAHSYGGVSAVLAACVAPKRFASLTIIEAPLWSVAPRDPEVEELIALARAFVRGAPEAREAFLAIAELPLDHEQTRRTERLARALRDPGEAVPDLVRLRSAGIPIAIVSGAHNTALERASDALAEALNAERWVLPGAGHAAQRVPELNQRLLARIRALIPL